LSFTVVGPFSFYPTRTHRHGIIHWQGINTRDDMMSREVSFFPVNSE
jgi:hypothetical protein